MREAEAAAAAAAQASREDNFFGFTRPSFMLAPERQSSVNLGLGFDIGPSPRSSKSGASGTMLGAGLGSGDEETGLLREVLSAVFSAVSGSDVMAFDETGLQAPPSPSPRHAAQTPQIPYPASQPSQSSQPSRSRPQSLQLLQSARAFESVFGALGILQHQTLALLERLLRHRPEITAQR